MCYVDNSTAGERPTTDASESSSVFVAVNGLQLLTSGADSMTSPPTTSYVIFVVFGVTSYCVFFCFLFCAKKWFDYCNAYCLYCLYFFFFCVGGKQTQHKRKI